MVAGRITPDPNPLPEAAIDALLADDLPAGDLTTQGLGIGRQPGRMTFTARRELVLCGSHEAARLLSRVGAYVTKISEAGVRAEKGQLLLEAEGCAAALFAGWKLAQNVMEWASGIATSSYDIVSSARAAAPQIAILCTRKSAPFTRQLSLKAVMAGGAGVHRLGLSDSIMLFPEHRAFLGPSIDFKAACARLKASAPERNVMVEVTSRADALAAADAMVDVIQLEKLDVETVRRIVESIERRKDGRPFIAAAGGITVHNAADYARTGVDTLVTSAPFNAPPSEIQVRIVPQ